MTYLVKEIFHTIQGEGSNSGTPAIFVRFAGCNLWTGDPEHRARDAERHRTTCARWCDTDFRDGSKVTLQQMPRILDTAIAAHATRPNLVVLTGGEPLLQLDSALLDLLRSRFDNVAVETNGTIAAKPGLLDDSHVCVSPKTRPEEVKVRSGTELKVVYPDSVVEPEEYAQSLGHFFHYWISPLARTETSKAGVSVVDVDNMARAAEYVMTHPRWKLSLQAHKIAGLP